MVPVPVLGPVAGIATVDLTPPHDVVTLVAAVFVTVVTVFIIAIDVLLASSGAGSLALVSRICIGAWCPLLISCNVGALLSMPRYLILSMFSMMSLLSSAYCFVLLVA